MKKFFTLLALCFLLFSSCKKTDSCTGVTCYNGGACNNGACNCPSGWTGTNCQTQVVTDPCANVHCYNGGTCANGVCNCPQGYGGSDCSQQQTPTHIHITKIDVIKFAPYDSLGSSWDIGSSADIYPLIYLGNNIVANLQSQHISDATYTTTYSFPLSSALDITDVTNPSYAIALKDYDTGSSDDFMAGFYFAPYWSNTNGFPAVITINGTGTYYNQFSFKLYVTYTW